MNIERFIKELEKINITLNEFQLKQLHDYYLLLIEWNQKINLTRITDEEDVYLKHFFDSLTLYKIMDLKQEITMCDVGSGAGFPGIVLKIVFPNLNIVLIDSLNKRIKFLNEVIDTLQLKNIESIHCRMEDFSRKNRNKFDVVVSRAVSNINIMAEISIPALKIGGHMILMKANCEEEIESSNKTLKLLNSKINKINKFILPVENSNRTIIDVIKILDTPLKYPRSIDKIKKSL